MFELLRDVPNGSVLPTTFTLRDNLEGDFIKVISIRQILLTDDDGLLMDVEPDCP